MRDRVLDILKNGSTEDDLPVAPDPSGWTAHPSERRDFYHRVRAMPPNVSEWRRDLIQVIARDQRRFPLAAKPDSPKALQLALDDGISFLREVARILAILHGTPDLGNKKDPVDELVYIVLSRKTREGAYQKSFAR